MELKMGDDMVCFWRLALASDVNGGNKPAYNGMLYWFSKATDKSPPTYTQYTIHLKYQNQLIHMRAEKWAYIQFIWIWKWIWIEWIWLYKQANKRPNGCAHARTHQYNYYTHSLLLYFIVCLIIRTHIGHNQFYTKQPFPPIHSLPIFSTQTKSDTCTAHNISVYRIFDYVEPYRIKSNRCL